jgi:hypothetical protein
MHVNRTRAGMQNKKRGFLVLELGGVQSLELRSGADQSG